MTPDSILDAIWPAFILFFLLLPLIIVSRPRRIKLKQIIRYLNRQHGLRMDIVMRLGNDQLRIAETVTPKEMAAVLLLWCHSLDRVDRFDRLSAAIQEGWLDAQGSEFYEAVERMGRDLETIGFGGFTAAMYKLGVHAARILQAEDWAEKFDDHLIAFEDRYELNRY